MQVALWYTAALTGMRRGEVCGLRWSDLDLKAGTASVQRARVIVGGEVAVSPPKTARGRRVVALDDGTVAQLHRWKKVQAAQKLERGKEWSDRDGYVFTHEAAYAQGETRFGVPVRPDWMGSAFRALVAEVGLPAIRLHDLRHTWATLAFQEKQHPKTVADQLGHANISVTLDIYSHAVPGLQTEAVGRVAKLALAKR